MLFLIETSVIFVILEFEDVAREQDGNRIFKKFSKYMITFFWYIFLKQAEAVISLTVVVFLHRKLTDYTVPSTLPSQSLNKWKC